jgi:hypothetical protein
MYVGYNFLSTLMSGSFAAALAFSSAFLRFLRKLRENVSRINQGRMGQQPRQASKAAISLAVFDKRPILFCVQDSFLGCSRVTKKYELIMVLSTKMYLATPREEGHLRSTFMVIHHA